MQCRRSICILKSRMHIHDTTEHVLQLPPQLRQVGFLNLCLKLSDLLASQKLATFFSGLRD